MLYSFLIVVQLISVVLCHGYIKFVGVDNKVWPSWTTTDEISGAKRIAFSNKQYSESRFAVQSQLLPDITCNKQAKAGELIAPARAGSNLTFMWSPWLVSHKGAILTYMAPYKGDIANANLQQLKFFKIQEKGLLGDNKTWATDEMIQNKNMTSATIPHDIKPGKYVIRHEIIALHFATEDSVWELSSPDAVMGPQHYIQCFNVDISGTGTETPEGVTFPGAYKHFRQEPGLYFDIYWGITPYPIPGPPLYRASTPAPSLTELPAEFSSPMGSVEENMKWFANMFDLARENDIGIFHLNQQRPKHGPLGAGFDKPAGIVSDNQTILGPGTFLGCRGVNCTGPIPRKGPPGKFNR